MQKTAEFKITIYVANYNPDVPSIAEKVEQELDVFKDKIEMACNSFKYPGWMIEVES